MNKKIFLIIALIVMVVAVSCGQKAEEQVANAESFVYTNFADAKSAAEASGKHMVLDFYTDW